VEPLKVLAAVVGALVVALTVRSATKTFIVPRGRTEIVTNTSLELTAALFRPSMSNRLPFVRRSTALALFAPVALLVTYALWLLLASIGFSLIYWADGVTPFPQALALSGSSFFTLGYDAPAGGLTMLGTIVEAGLGLFLIALLIGYLPTIYSAFREREAVVAAVAARAGTPPSGVNLLVHHEYLGGWDAVAEVWPTMEAWFAQIGESHRAITLLPFYRSLDADRHWVTAAGASLDGAALAVSTVEGDVATRGARLMLHAGSHVLWEMADHLALRPGPRPADWPPSPRGVPTELTVTRAEWEEGRAALAAAGIPVKADADGAWAEFASLRAQYDRSLVLLAALLFAPPAPWIATVKRPPLHFVRFR
jgi:hypothetical protein